MEQPVPIKEVVGQGAGQPGYPGGQQGFPGGMSWQQQQQQSMMNQRMGGPGMYGHPGQRMPGQPGHPGQRMPGYGGYDQRGALVVHLTGRLSRTVPSQLTTEHFTELPKPARYAWSWLSSDTRLPQQLSTTTAYISRRLPSQLWHVRCRSTVCRNATKCKNTTARAASWTSRTSRTAWYPKPTETNA